MCSFSKEVRLSSSVIFCVLLERVLDSLLKPLIKNIVGFLLTWYFVTGVSFISDYAAILLVVIEESIFSKKKKLYSITSICICQKWRKYTLFYFAVMTMKFGKTFKFIIWSLRGMLILKEEWHLPSFMSSAGMLYTLF